MNYNIVFHPEAEKEYIAGLNWYEKEKAGLGLEFEEAINKVLYKISLQPENYSYTRGDYREAKISIFPYSIVFKISHKKNFIYVVAVYHTKRNPRKKYRK
jgi:mRNA-degrading endonuclease RelE of RelBE toxin-antitoxin system